MPRYSKVNRKIPARDELLLTKTTRDNENGLILGNHDSVAPGLYPGEETFELDDGNLIALRVETHWLSNGEGVSFHAFARLIEDDGSSKLSARNQHIGSAFTYSVPALFAIEHGVDAIATDVARIILGEEPYLKVMVPMGEGEEPQEQPLLNISDMVKANANIRAQIKLAEQVREYPKISL